MSALKAARAFTGRAKIAKCEGAYHGSYDYAEVSLDAPVGASRTQFESVPYAAGTPAGVLNDVDRTVDILRAHRHQLAAILVDPMPNRAGLVPAHQSYLTALREIATEIGAVLVFDEVITFRLGYHGAQAIWNIDADLTVFGKIMGGGYPKGQPFWPTR